MCVDLISKILFYLSFLSFKRFCIWCSYHCCLLIQFRIHMRCFKNVKCGGKIISCIKTTQQRETWKCRIVIIIILWAVVDGVGSDVHNLENKQSKQIRLSKISLWTHSFAIIYFQNGCQSPTANDTVGDRKTVDSHIEDALFASRLSFNLTCSITCDNWKLKLPFLYLAWVTFQETCLGFTSPDSDTRVYFLLLNMSRGHFSQTFQCSEKTSQTVRWDLKIT